MPPGRARNDRAVDRENEAWRLRCKGWTQDRIAKHLGVAQPSVWEMLKKAGARRKGETESYVLEHIGQLDAAIEQGFASWFASKKPTQRKRETTDEEGNVITVYDLVERNGTVSYLYAAFAAMDRKAKVLGINVADMPQEQTFTIASLTGEIAERRRAYDSRDEEIPPADTGQPEAGAGGGDTEVQE